MRKGSIFSRWEHQSVNITPPEPELAQKIAGICGQRKAKDEVLTGKDARRKMDEIARIWKKMRDAGASHEILQAYYDESGFDELCQKAKQEDEFCRLRGFDQITETER